MDYTARVVCGSCKQTTKQLFVIRDSENKKTNDYICIECKGLGKKVEPNSSKQTIPTKAQIKEMVDQLYREGRVILDKHEVKSDSSKKSETGTVALEGDRIPKSA